MTILLNDIPPFVSSMTEKNYEKFESYNWEGDEAFKA
jgi:hypothetical protein